MPQDEKKVLTSEMTDKIAKVLKEMEDLDYQPGETIDIGKDLDLGHGTVAWHCAYKT